MISLTANLHRREICCADLLRTRLGLRLLTGVGVLWVGVKRIALVEGIRVILLSLGTLNTRRGAEHLRGGVHDRWAMRAN